MCAVLPLLHKLRETEGIDLKSNILLICFLDYIFAFPLDYEYGIHLKNNWIHYFGLLSVLVLNFSLPIFVD